MARTPEKPEYARAGRRAAAPPPSAPGRDEGSAPAAPARAGAAARAGRRGAGPAARAGRRGAGPAPAPPAGGARGDARGGGAAAPGRRKIERVQTGVRLERRILGMLKALADLHGLSLGDLLEGIVLHAFEGKAPFAGPSLEKIAALRGVFGLDLGAEDSHLLVERRAAAGGRPKARSPGA